MGLIHPSLETAPFDEFQLIVSQLDELGLGVEFSHGFRGKSLVVRSEGESSEQITNGWSTHGLRKLVDGAHKRNEGSDCVGSLRTTAFDEFQLIVSQLDDLGLGVEFRHGFEVR